MGDFSATLIRLRQLIQLHQRQRGVDIGQIIFEAGSNHFRLRRAAVGLTVVGVYAQAVEFEAADAGSQLVIIGDDKPPSAQVIFLIAWNEKIAVPRQPTWRPL